MENRLARHSGIQSRPRNLMPQGRWPGGPEGSACWIRGQNVFISNFLVHGRDSKIPKIVGLLYWDTNTISRQKYWNI
ncbi:hypothetical protein GGD56_005477 [Rhizobium mongolense]|uniref:Uncharacterized protein n=2 Tax=Rhizobium mongolense TaxID=57676 RepID=A0ABR6IUL8_9HYPH|nr:hypothetical protein [Rhizobium mongolense]TVZ64178.1 hypothetical protein BCL32_4394 [Rhizobium mongolense USDA 1844]